MPKFMRVLGVIYFITVSVAEVYIYTELDELSLITIAVLIGAFFQALLILVALLGLANIEDCVESILSIQKQTQTATDNKNDKETGFTYVEVDGQRRKKCLKCGNISEGIYTSVCEKCGNDISN